MSLMSPEKIAKPNLKVNDYINPTHYAWQAGIRFLLSSAFRIPTSAFF
jgi:hypothetical protein